MKKLMLAAGVVLLAACSQEEATVLQEPEAQNKQMEVIVNGEVRTLNFTLEDGELMISQDEEFAKVSEVLSSETLRTVISSEVDQVLYFTDEAKLEEFNAKPEILASLTKTYGRLNQSKPTIMPKSSNLGFSIHKAHSMGGSSYTVATAAPRWYNRHLSTNKCRTGNIDFDNDISSFRVFQGTRTDFFEDPGYGGKVLTVLAINSDAYVPDLAKLKKQSFTITDGSYHPDYRCIRWLLCLTSFNDRITSISSARYGFSLDYINSNTCSTGSGGGGGGVGTDPDNHQ